MARLYDYIFEVREKSRDEFVAAHAKPFVLQHVPPKLDAQWTFKTQTLSSTGVSIAQLIVREGLKVSNELARYNVFEVTKSAANPWPDRVSVGRARNNDIVLADGSVSKLHAHFTMEHGHHFLLDAGSRNGTRINDAPLAERGRARLSYGDVLTFGAQNVTFIDGGRLYDMVRRGLED